MKISDSGIAGAHTFPSTSWSALRQIRANDGANLKATLSRLAALYWKPIHCVIRYQWSRSSDEAKDLTQDFFAEVVLDAELFRAFAPELGSFRSFLRAALSNFMKNTIRDSRRKKRGGGTLLISLEGDPMDLIDLASGKGPPTPEQLFDIAWDGFVLQEALHRLREQMEGSGRAEHFEAFRRYDLDGEQDDKSYEDMATELGWTVRKLRRVLTETRAGLRKALAEVVCPSLDNSKALGGELRRLLGG